MADPDMSNRTIVLCGRTVARVFKKSGLAFAKYDEPTWFLLTVIAVELAAVIVLLSVLVAR